MLAPKRQVEIEDIVDHVARFKPTRVALECSPAKQAEYDKRYAEHRAGSYVLSRDERDQIGMRLAAKLNLEDVDCVDYQDGAPGPREDYDFGAFGQKHSEMTTFLQDTTVVGERMATEEASFLKAHTLLDWYRRANERGKRQEENALYVRYVVRLGNVDSNLGANWIGSWHARNIIIVENVRRLAKPGDRVFTLFGSGHGYLLTEFATESAAFDMVDAEAYLRYSLSK